ncbi:hypothetical protein TKK_0016945 [Trichogramma kaykai]|uniref:SAM-dependent MTase RsmB/NOP-type domain-containing protein n=2 Tax=Trichogramma kaykai TaxID=54128 RepID=A0ABD2W3U0_9HYME
MNHTGANKFVHSIKVPKLFKEATKIVKKVAVDGASFKSLTANPRHPNVQGIYALVSETLRHSKELQYILDYSKILIENPRFDPWLARVLITELLWGKKVLKSEAIPIVTVLSYKEKLLKALEQISDAVADPSDKKKVDLPRYVRINTLLMSIDEAFEAFYNDGWNLLPKCEDYKSHLETLSNMGPEDYIQDFHIPEVFAFPPGTKFHDHPGYLKGKFLLQDKASCFPAFLLNPKPNSCILDMCSAPGMKTTHLAAIINNTGKIYAVELHEGRHKTLSEFVSHTGAECVDVIQADALTITPEQYPNVEYILVDPSCSGSGMARIEFMNQDRRDLFIRLKKLRNLQAMILTHALCDFPNVKKVVYSTCSLYPEENEEVVDEVFRKVSDKFKLVNLEKKLNGQWNNFGAQHSRYSCSDGKSLYALPEKDLCNGFFLAVFKRKSSAEVEENLIENDEIETCLDNQQEDTSKDSEKKRKNKTRSNHQDYSEIKTDDNVDESVIHNTEEDVTEGVPKKKKKRKIADQDNIENKIDTNFDESAIDNTEKDVTNESPKKKKKKSSKKITDNTTNMNENLSELKQDNIVEHDEVTVKDKKKKKKKKNDEKSENH